MTGDATLAGLVASRICHDLISPVGALGNGLELVAGTDGGDAEAMELIADCAAAARAVLAFHRIAFGAAGPDDELDAREAADAARAFFAPKRLEVDWPASGSAPKRELKARLLLALIAAEALPRGGRIAAASGPAIGWIATGMISADSDRVRERVLSGIAAEELTPGQAHHALLQKTAASMTRQPYARMTRHGDEAAFEVGLA